MAESDGPDLLDLTLPYRRRVQLREHEFDSGMKMLRMILREGTRITQIDVDADAANAIADQMKAWADTQNG